MEAVHSVWIIYMPLMLAGGLAFLVAGYRVLYGSELARRIAQVNAVLGYVWLAAYAVSCYRIMPVFDEMFSNLPFPSPKAFGLVSVVGTTAIAECRYLVRFGTVWSLSKTNNALI